MIHKKTLLFFSASIVFFFSFAAPSQAQENLAQLSEKGKALYFERVSCWVCHGDNAEGRVGPTLSTRPTPLDIQEQLESNPQMAVIVSEMSPDADDLVALSVFIAELTGSPAEGGEVAQWRSDIETLLASQGEETKFALTERDKKILEIQSFDTVLEDWERRAKVGNIKSEYQVQVLETYEPGEPVFNPEPGKLYFYENTGTSAQMVRDPSVRATSSQVVVGDASTKEVITYAEMPSELRGAVHTTALSPDGKYVYIVGPSGKLPEFSGPGSRVLRAPATLLKVDAHTLKPIKQLSVGGRMHHAQVFQDKYLLVDTFARDPDGLDVFLLDPETDEIIGGVREEDLGGENYTAYTDNEFIYVLMQPGEFEGASADFHGVAHGSMTALRPFWVSKIDPETWEVVAEYPYHGYRADWVVIEEDSEHIYIPASATSSLSKINTETGEIVWSGSTGTGPYGGTLNADESEIWVADKGEATNRMGRTVTVVDAESGRGIETLFSGYLADHVLLSPNGKEMWVTSNGEGRIYVFDAETREQTHVIDMPNFGDPHGLVWVYYDENGKGMVVRDQGGFHNGVHPARGRPLDY